MKQIEYIGQGSINNLKTVLDKEKPKKIFLVTGKKSYELSGAKKAIEPLLEDFEVIHFSDFSTNPKIEDVEKGMKLFDDCDFVIAVGGGSVIDTAKSINLFNAQSSSSLEIIKKEKPIEKPGKPLVAIPTTAGSGSEATRFAVVYVEKIKNSLDHDYVVPNYSISDSNFIANLPKKIAAAGAMDALGQAVESYWSVNSNDESKEYAGESIKLAIENSIDAINNGSPIAQEKIMKAANLAGKAINISKTTASHAVSYPITSHFGVLHGHAVALTLPSMLVFNLNVTDDDVLDKRGANYVRKTLSEIISLIGTSDADSAKMKLTNLMSKLGLEIHLKELGISSDSDIQIILDEGFNPDRVKNNPRKLTVEYLKKILVEII